MRQLAPRRFPTGRHRDASGKVRLIEPAEMRRGFDDEADARVALVADPQGLG